MLWKHLVEIAQLVSKRFGLVYGKIVPETRKRCENKGECFVCEACFNRAKKILTSCRHRGEKCVECSKKSDRKSANCKHKTVHLRVHRLHKVNTPLTPKTIIRILAHELAHCRPDTWAHGKAHTQLTKDILKFLREEGHY